MSSRRTIRMNYQRAIGQAEKLDVLSEQIRKVANTTIKNAKAEQAAGWKGENEAAMRAKMEILQDKVVNTAKSLKNVADTIRIVAKNTYNAEMRAWEIAHRRTYGG